jgi:hypothetical protein
MDQVVPSVLVDERDRHWIEGRNHWVDSMGYVSVYLGGGRQERLHRLICDPPAGLGVDHINRNKLDNRRSNLRVCAQQVNCLNVGARCDSKSGIRGVWWSEKRRKWCAQITAQGRRVSLGRFDTLEEASAARSAAEAALWAPILTTSTALQA